jgi:hypothetical protein
MIKPMIDGLVSDNHSFIRIDYVALKYERFIKVTVTLQGNNGDKINGGGKYT